MSDSFSKRHGFRQVRNVPITIRADAPRELRGVIVQLAYGCGFSPRPLRPLVCRTLRKRQDDDNWSEYPNIDNEIHSLVDGCEWYRVYDVIEAIAAAMHDAPYSYDPDRFQTELNDYFTENRIGWKLSAGSIEVRGDEPFERSIQRAQEQLQSSGFATATNELSEALHVNFFLTNCTYVPAPAFVSFVRGPSTMFVECK